MYNCESLLVKLIKVSSTDYHSLLKTSKLDSGQSSLLSPRTSRTLDATLLLISSD